METSLLGPVKNKGFFVPLSYVWLLAIGTRTNENKDLQLNMVSALTRLVLFSHRHPLALGMMSYATLWPVSSLIQQTTAGKNLKNYDWMQAARFSLFGSLYSAPSLYIWLKYNRKWFPGTNLRTSLLKAVIDQVSYGPFHLASFFFGMSLLEGKTLEAAKKEVQRKFFPTWKIGVCVWPFLSTINHTYVKERYKIPFVSFCSLLWCCFLAYMHQLNQQEPKHKSGMAVKNQ